MSDALLLVIVLLLAAILGATVDIALKIRRLCGWCRPAVHPTLGKPRIHHMQPLHKYTVVGFSIWAFVDGQWILLQGCGQAGCDCGPPPPRPGAYEGQVVRKECPAREAGQEDRPRS